MEANEDLRRRALSVLNESLGWRDVHDVEPAGAGEWSIAYGFVHGDRRFVVRLGAHPEHFAKDMVMSRHTRPGLPIPEVVAMGAAPGPADSHPLYFVVAHRVFGRFIDDLSPAELDRALPALLVMLDALATKKVEGSTGFGCWDASGRGSAASWRDALLQIGEGHDFGGGAGGWRAALGTLPDCMVAFDKGYEVLTHLLRDVPDAQLVVHSDLLHRNVLVESGDVERLAGVIDWGNALFGDPLYDLTTLLFWIPRTPGWHDVNVWSAVRRHWQARGATPHDSPRRLRAYALHEALAALAYSAWKGRASTETEQRAQWVHDLVRQPFSNVPDVPNSYRR